MHAIHEAFVNRPVFCKLEDFFFLLDQIGVKDRHLILAHIYPDVFKTMEIKCPSGIKTEEGGMEYAYEEFKEWCRSMADKTTSSFVVFSVLSLALAWACRNSDEKIIPGIIASNENEKRKARKACAEGRISKEQLAEIEAKWDENIASLPSEVKQNKARYTWFCENVVERLPRDDPQ
jgi:hypothetical protein